MRLLTWLLRLFLFIVMLGFALSNTDSVTLHFFGIPDAAWRAPLVLFLLVFFAAGILLGALSSVPLVLRQRRELGRLRRDVARAAATGGATGGAPGGASGGAAGSAVGSAAGSAAAAGGAGPFVVGPADAVGVGAADAGPAGASVGAARRPPGPREAGGRGI